MLRLLLVVAVLLKLSAADGTATIPTELFKPLAPVKENSLSENNMPSANYRTAPNRPINDINEPNSFKGYPNVHTFFADDGMPNIAQTEGLNPDHIISRFENFNTPFPVITHEWSNFPENTNFGPTSKNGYFQISSRSSYFNSETMTEPEIRHFEYDSRNSGVKHDFVVS